MLSAGRNCSAALTKRRSLVHFCKKRSLHVLRRDFGFDVVNRAPSCITHIHKSSHSQQIYSYRNHTPTSPPHQRGTDHFSAHTHTHTPQSMGITGSRSKKQRVHVAAAEQEHAPAPVPQSSANCTLTSSSTTISSSGRRPERLTFSVQPHAARPRRMSTVSTSVSGDDSDRFCLFDTCEGLATNTNSGLVSAVRAELHTYGKDSPVFPCVTITVGEPRAELNMIAGPASSLREVPTTPAGAMLATPAHRISVGTPPPASSDVALPPKKPQHRNAGAWRGRQKSQKARKRIAAAKEKRARAARVRSQSLGCSDNGDVDDTVRRHSLPGLIPSKQTTSDAIQQLDLRISASH